MAGVLVFLFLLQFILSAYHHSTFSKIMVLASYAVGFNILLGYTGLMSLGHAMFFSTGMYVTGICVYHFGFTGIPALGVSLVITVFVSMLIGAVALRTSGVSFLIVTLMSARPLFYRFSTSTDSPWDRTASHSPKNFNPWFLEVPPFPTPIQISNTMQHGCFLPFA